MNQRPSLAQILFCVILFSGINCYSQNPPAEWLPNDRALNPLTAPSDVTLDGDARERARHSHTRGLQWSLYSIKVPLAWKLTRGDALIGIEFPGQYNLTEGDSRDIESKTGPNDSGNWIDNGAATIGDGADTTLPARNGHEYGVASVAVALADNDGTGVEQAGMVGVCPECVAGYSVAGNRDSLVPRPERIVDIDMKNDGVVTGFALVNQSFGAAYVTPSFDTSGVASDFYNSLQWSFLRKVDSAKVVVSSAGNDFRSPKIYLDTMINGEALRYFLPSVFIPGCLDFADTSAGSSPDSDIGFINVGAIEDGGLWCSDSSYCQGGAFGCDYNSGFMARGVEQFRPTYHFSLGTNKFSQKVDVTARLEEKFQAMIDLVAPGGDILITTDSDSRYGFTDGTSNSAPLVSGVAGLMLSIDRWLGSNAGRDVNQNIINGRSVHRRAYNLLTFTADKINDNAAAFWYEQPPQFDTVDSITRRVFLWNNNLDGSPVQYNYATATNDHLRRSRAQRMGFGKVNAYRAVAHTIPLKAAQRFTGSETLPFDNDERGPLGQRIMHMGAWYREGPNEDVNNNSVNGEVLDLYEAGGASLPGEFHNNQGVTELNGSGIVLTVPDDATLAIDGIVTTDNPTGGNQLTTATGGEIIIEGMLDNVELMGDTFVGDLIIRGETGTYGCLMAGPDQDNVSEVFGKVEMRDSAAVFVRGWMRMRPGGQITMNGARDIWVKPGGTLEMMYGSRIERNPDTHFERMIVIDSGATLLIPDGAHVDLFTHVYVLPHGKVQIGEDAAFSLDHFRVEQHGIFEIAAGAHLALRDPDYYSECQGHLIMNGTAEKQVRVTGRFPEIELSIDRIECEGVVDHARLVAKGYINNIPASSLQMNQTTFSNVSVQAINITFRYPEFGSQIRDCSFTAARSMGMPWQNLLEINYWPGDNDPVVSPREFSPNLIRCLFADEDGTDVGVERSRQDYDLMGLFTNSLDYLQVYDCDFRHLVDGVRTIDNFKVDVYQSDAWIVDNFLQIDGPGSESFECNNTASSVWRCGTYTSTARSQVFDAAYANIHSGIIGTSADRVWMRGSHLDFFVEGLRSNGAGIFLRPNENPGLENEYGRNVFVVAPRQQAQSEFFDPTRARRDAHMRDNGKVIPSCGLNNFAAETDLHLDANYFAGVVVTANRWNNADGNFGVRRGPKVTVFGSDLDESESAMNCGIDEDFQSCPSPPEIGQFGGMNAFGPLMDGNPDSVFIGGIDDLADPTLLPTVRRARAKDSFRAAVKSDSTKKRLDTLRTRIGTVLAADTTVTNDTLLRGGLQFLDGVILEKLRRFADARMAFELVCQSVPTSPDSMLAGWRLKKLDLLELGADHGADYDLAMNAWNDQMRADLKRYRTPLLPQAKRGGETGPPVGPNSCELLSIAPNPFDGKTSIAIRIDRQQHVRLEVADMQGRVLTVVADRQFSTGEHAVEFRNEGYAAGVYLCRMHTADGHVQTRQLFIR